MKRGMKKWIGTGVLLGSVWLGGTAAWAQPAQCPYDINNCIWHNAMTDIQKTFYDQLYDGIRSGAESVPVPFGLTTEATREVFEAVALDNSELCSIDYNLSGIEGSGEDRVYRLYYCLPLAEQEKLIRDAEEIAEQFKGMPDMEGLRSIHDYICKRYEYDYENMIMGGSAYGALTDNIAICNGYAETMAILAHFAGYQCSYVTGYGLEEDGSRGPNSAHAWNVAIADGRQFWLDTTWDDLGGDEVGDGYWNLTLEEMSKDHELVKVYKKLDKLENISLVAYLDINDEYGYVGGPGEANGITVSESDLGEGQFYTPACVVYNNSDEDRELEVKMVLDGEEETWGKGTAGPNGNGLIYRPSYSWLKGKLGTHTVSWYCNGNRMRTFTWTVTE